MNVYREEEQGLNSEALSQMLRGWGEKEKPLRDQEGAPREVEGNPEACGTLEARKEFQREGII